MRSRIPFKESWQLLLHHRLLFVPRVLKLFLQLVLLLCFLWLTGISKAILTNDYFLLSAQLSSPAFYAFFLVYVIAFLLFDNYFVTAEYGLLGRLFSGKKLKLSHAWDFAREYFGATLGIHAITYLLVMVPSLLAFYLLFFLLPVNDLVAVTLFVPLFLAYVAYLSMRLLYVFPVMTFKREGAYASLRDDFHFVKTHLHHTFLTWLLVLAVMAVYVIFRENASALSVHLTGTVYAIWLLVFFIVIALEVVVTVWEHTFVFASYIEAKKRRRKRSRKR